MKKIARTITFKDIPKKYSGLIELFPLRPLNDKVDYENAGEIIDAMAGHDLNKDQDDYLAVLSTLVNQYDTENMPQPFRENDPIGNLEFLLEQHQMNASDLGRILNERTLGSKILRRERELSKMHIRKIAEYFNTNPAIFL